MLCLCGFCVFFFFFSHPAALRQALENLEPSLGACHVWSALWDRAHGLRWDAELGLNHVPSAKLRRAERVCACALVARLCPGHEPGQLPSVLVWIRRNQCPWHFLGPEHQHQGGRRLVTVQLQTLQLVKTGLRCDCKRKRSYSRKHGSTTKQQAIVRLFLPASFLPSFLPSFFFLTLVRMWSGSGWRSSCQDHLQKCDPWVGIPEVRKVRSAVLAVLSDVPDVPRVFQSISPGQRPTSRVSSVWVEYETPRFRHIFQRHPPKEDTLQRWRGQRSGFHSSEQRFISFSILSIAAKVYRRKDPPCHQIPPRHYQRTPHPPPTTQSSRGLDYDKWEADFPDTRLLRKGAKLNPQCPYEWNVQGTRKKHATDWNLRISWSQWEKTIQKEEIQLLLTQTFIAVVWVSEVTDSVARPSRLVSWGLASAWVLMRAMSPWGAFFFLAEQLASRGTFVSTLWSFTTWTFGCVLWIWIKRPQPMGCFYPQVLAVKLVLCACLALSSCTEHWCPRGRWDMVDERREIEVDDAEATFVCSLAFLPLLKHLKLQR